MLMATPTGIEPVISSVTGWRNNHLYHGAIDATYTESPTANYRMNTADATRNSRKNDGNGGKKEKGLKVSQLATDFITYAAIFLLTRCQTGKAALKMHLSNFISVHSYYLSLYLTYILYHKFLKKSN